MKVAIIDDESSVRETLRTIIELQFPTLEIKEAESVADGVNLIKEYKPNLIFTDIKLGDGTGFDLLNRIKGTLDFQLVFVTAHNEYAVKAFKFSAIDYILKPIDFEEVRNAINKALKNEPASAISYNALINNTLQTPQKIVLSDTQNIHLVDIDDIMYCMAVSNYTHFYLEDNREIVISKTLKHYDDLLQDSGFFRVHQSYIINLKYFGRYSKRDSGEAVLKNGKIIPVSTRKRDNLFKVLKEFLN